MIERLQDYGTKEFYNLKKYEQDEFNFIKKLTIDSGKSDDVLNDFKKRSSNEHYHYTDLNGLLGIFKNYIENRPDKVYECTMRASQIRFLNDTQEYIEGSQKYKEYGHKYYDEIAKYIRVAQYEKTIKERLDLYEKILQDGSKGIIKNISALLQSQNYNKNLIEQVLSDVNFDEDIYSISFCGNGNLLSQWKYYGRNSGIAIKFNLEKANLIIGNQANNIIDAKPFKVAYSENEKKILFAMSCLITNEEDPIIQKAQADIFIPYCKNEAFKEENESRLVFDRPQTVRAEYSISEGKIKPYIPITLKACEGKNIIDSITVGPGEHQNLVYNALIHIFDSDSFRFENGKGNHECKNGVTIIKSDIPFRS